MSFVRIHTPTLLYLGHYYHSFSIDKSLNIFVTDIDECSSSDMCTGLGQYCQNTPGAYKCLCKAGFFQDNETCKDGKEPVY